MFITQLSQMQEVELLFFINLLILSQSNVNGFV